MENLLCADANHPADVWPRSGASERPAVSVSLLLKIGFDQNLIRKAIGDEDFLEEADDEMENIGLPGPPRAKFAFGFGYSTHGGKSGSSPGARSTGAAKMLRSCAEY
jgi:hypothetical protein